MLEPEVLVFMIPILGILLGMLSVWTKHKEKLARIASGEGGGERNARTLELLTDTLEREHERLVQLQERVERLEAQTGRAALTEAAPRRVDS